MGERVLERGEPALERHRAVGLPQREQPHELGHRLRVGQDQVERLWDSLVCRLPFLICNEEVVVGVAHVLLDLSKEGQPLHLCSGAHEAVDAAGHVEDHDELRVALLGLCASAHPLAASACWRASNCGASRCPCRPGDGPRGGGRKDGDPGGIGPVDGGPKASGGRGSLTGRPWSSTAPACFGRRRRASPRVVPVRSVGGRPERTAPARRSWRRRGGRRASAARARGCRPCGR